MPRKPRIYLPDMPAHVVQRGNNRNACFFSEEDYLFYLECLSNGLRRYHVKLHAYVLMTNHVHLLLTPTDATGISCLLQQVGRLYVLYINKSYRRSGTLWEGRHKASLVDAEHYLLACYRYIEMNPVTARMVATPDEYRWSSYAGHAWGKPNRLISGHELYDRLGHNPEARQFAYRELFRHSLSDKDTHAIRESLAFNYPLGNDRFREQVESALGRKVGEKQRGRPRRQNEIA